MKAIETLEAELWLAQRAQRRNPSEENQAKVEAIEAEIAALNIEDDSWRPAEPADALVETKVVALNPSTLAESAEAGQGEKATAGNANPADAQAETQPTGKPQKYVEEPGTLAKVADASAEKPPVIVVEEKPKKEVKPKAPAKKKEEPAN